MPLNLKTFYLKLLPRRLGINFNLCPFKRHYKWFLSYKILIHRFYLGRRSFLWCFAFKNAILFGDYLIAIFFIISDSLFFFSLFMKDISELQYLTINFNISLERLLSLVIRLLSYCSSSWSLVTKDRAYQLSSKPISSYLGIRFVIIFR